MVLDLNDTYRMMMIKMIMKMMKTQNGRYSANFETTTSRFCMALDINDSYRLSFMQNLSLIFQMRTHLAHLSFLLLNCYINARTECPLYFLILSFVKLLYKC